uniref:(northern house mosquito) hypothetical protein n=1 Tax=Culex pipiens TaxID=7175 RepID=A0A8D8F0E4_CULPI
MESQHIIAAATTTSNLGRRHQRLRKESWCGWYGMTRETIDIESCLAVSCPSLIYIKFQLFTSRFLEILDTFKLVLAYALVFFSFYKWCLKYFQHERSKITNFMGTKIPNHPISRNLKNVKIAR